MNRFVKKLRRNFQDYGFLVFLQKTASSLFSFLYLQRTYRIYFYDLKEDLPECQERSDIIIRRITPEEIELIEQIEEMTEWLSGTLKNKLETNSFCICALEGKAVTGYNLITLKQVCIPLLQINRKLRSKVAWSEQISVSKKYRRRGIARSLRAFVLKDLKNAGYTRLFGGTLINNQASLKLAEKVGFHMLVDVTLTKFLRLKRLRYKKAV